MGIVKGLCSLIVYECKHNKEFILGIIIGIIIGKII